MADDAGSLAQRLSVRRQLEQLVQPEPATPRPAKLPLRILYIVSRPTDAGFIDPRMTAKALLDALDPLGAKGRPSIPPEFLLYRALKSRQVSPPSLTFAYRTLPSPLRDPGLFRFGDSSTAS